MKHGFWSLCALLLLGFAMPALAQAPDAKKSPMEEMKVALDAATASISELKTSTKVGADTVWVMITGMLVFFMNLGFATVESGFCRAKNCVNILSKNFVVFAATTIGFWFIGWGLMFGNNSSPYYGSEGMLMVSGADNSPVTGALAGLIKSDIKEMGVDLADPEVAKKHEALIAKIDEISGEATSTITASKKKVKNKEGKEEEVAVTFPVKLEIPGKGKLEKEYEASSFYYGAYSALNWVSVPMWAKFFFQLVFAGTAATIVSGAVAERIKYHSFIIFSFIMAICIYPIVGHWIWGGGVLALKGFVDFAGSTQVHSIGGWAALAGILVLGPRIGKYGPNGKVNAIPGHNLTAATIGCFILWFGWFGFNPGSTMAVDGAAIAEVAITTNLAACAATLSATIVAWLLLGKPDLGMTLNGCLAGLVAITAPCAFVTAEVSLVIGAIAGVVVVLAVIGFDRIKIDDPVGATSVHLVNGVLGTIFVGIFSHPDKIARSGNALHKAGLFYGGGTDQLIVQLTGVAYCAVYVFVVSMIAWIALRATIGIRVSPEEEMEGLDIGEHGNEAYHGFVLATSGETMSGSVEPKSASLPRDSKKRFTVIVEGLPAEKIASIWGDLCMPSKKPSPDFLAIYPKMTMLMGNRFRFIDGNPEQVAGHLGKLLQTAAGQGTVKTSVEK